MLDVLRGPIYLNKFNNTGAHFEIAFLASCMPQCYRCHYITLLDIDFDTCHYCMSSVCIV